MKVAVGAACAAPAVSNQPTMKSSQDRIRTCKRPIVNPHLMSQPQGVEVRLPIPPPDYKNK